MNLITGVTGIVGAHVALRLLSEGKPVVAIKRMSSDLSKTKSIFSCYSNRADELFLSIQWVEADLCDIYSLLDVLDGIESVYHCAGFVSFHSKHHSLMHKVNADGTANLVNACLEKKIKAFCYVSSIATLQNPDIKTNIDESVYWKSSPVASDYAISKYNGEREVWRGSEEGLNVVIVNPGIVLSAGIYNQSSGKLFGTCYKGNPFYTNGSSATVDARDVAACMVMLTEKSHFNQRFILIENNYSFREILSCIHRGFGKKEPHIEAGKMTLSAGRFFDGLKSKLTGQEQLITKETVISALDKNFYSNNRIKRVLNYTFIPLNDSIAFICQSFLENQRKKS
ncbi:MAG: NAD-dependent epimerase/dehydratase family protein [Bacteroidota bacterium]|jgi:nucleoside-diphosphate-sugar epimerase|nr:NAD-dependent epimerase/dehydratase family protein [Bacteroidota bacterium]